ncbi:hypothetical protein HN51_049324 [Arachis hypogaea]|uniref:Uncharacterized protein n=2 Tax=Arachis TaxID=3817 RepID=A0A444YFB1_ARAHY|nr:uncharacterized protein LOC107496290 [Arachis duranensis]XP_016166629.1 uncharacterized protein LOC107609256 [Arachis ipaensis]XP_025666151.1 uncharacterized protein LOC112764652 [Arachis hypogaea]RYR00633.1 hypothetical protein Ahy_B07g088757 [Arachis hypogaea]
MQALWVSLKDNVKCGSKLSDVIRQPPKCGKGSFCVSEKEKKINGDKDHNDPPLETPPSIVLSRPNNTLARLHELSVGDPSRKIVEMIFQKAWMNTSKPLRKIKTVLRVSYSEQVLERFEKYRENVKKNADEQHPRSTVDGNELLRFYATTVRCFQGKAVKKVHDLCKDLSCCLCQTIQFNFNTEHAKIQLNNDIGKEQTVATTRVRIVKRAAIVCRIIAGTSMNEVDGEFEGPVSNGLGEIQFSLEKFVVKNPSSILPCFVIIFS